MATQHYLTLALLISAMVMMAQAAKRHYPEQRLDEEFTGKLSNYFSPQVMSKMMSILASNQKIRNNKLNSASASSLTASSSSSLLSQPPPSLPQVSQPINFRLMDKTDFMEDRQRLKDFQEPYQRPYFASKALKLSHKPAESVIIPSDASNSEQPSTGGQNLIHLFHRFG